MNPTLPPMPSISLLHYDSSGSFPHSCRVMGEWGLWLVYGPQPVFLGQTFPLELSHWSNVSSPLMAPTGALLRGWRPVWSLQWLQLLRAMSAHSSMGFSMAAAWTQAALAQFSRGCRETPSLLPQDALSLRTSSLFSDPTAHKAASHTFFPLTALFCIPLSQYTFIEAPAVPSWGAQMWIWRVRGINWNHVYHSSPCSLPIPNIPGSPTTTNLFTDKLVISLYHIRLLNSSPSQSKSLMYNSYHLVGKTIN